jgi:PhnB protein
MPTKGSAIPKGFHSITPHLVVRDANKAIDFYKQVFGAQEQARMPGPDGKIMHAEIRIGDSVLLLADEFPTMQCVSPLSLNGTAVTVHLYVDNVDQVFERAIKAGAQVTMPVMDVFWGDRYGKFKDPFGHVWSVATHVWDLSPAETQKAAADAMKNMKP